MWPKRTKKINKCKLIFVISLIVFGIVSFILVSNIQYPSDIDSYYHLRIAEQIKENNGSLNFLQEDIYSSHPGRPFNYPPGYSYLLYILSSFGGLLIIWKFIPIVFLILTAIVIYLIAKRIFNENSALLASIFFLITPFVFHHIFLNDVGTFIFFISSLLTYFFILFLEKKTLLYASLFGSTMAVIMLSWLGGLFFVVFFYFYLAIIILYEIYKNKNFKFLIYSIISILIPIILLVIFIPEMALGCWEDEIIFCWLDAFSLFGRFGDWIFYIIVKLNIVGHYSDSWWLPTTSDFTMGINEMQPTTLILFLKYLTIISLMSFVAILVKTYGLLKNKTTIYHLFLMTWLLIVLIFAVPHAIRHMFLLIIPMVILAGWITDKICKRFNKSYYCLIIIMLLLLPTVANVNVVKENTYGSLQEEYFDAMNWIEKNAQDKVFINYWQVGHLISYARAKNSIDGLMYTQNIRENKAYHLHKFWLENEKNAINYMLLENYDYVWISQDYIHASKLIVYLGTESNNSEGYFISNGEVIIPPHLQNSLMTNMLFYQEYLTCFERVYHNKIVSIFKIKKECKNVNSNISNMEM